MFNFYPGAAADGSRILLVALPQRVYRPDEIRALYHDRAAGSRVDGLLDTRCIT